jgi:DNA-binding NarL/FixJ family response regulator
MEHAESHGGHSAETRSTILLVSHTPSLRESLYILLRTLSCLTVIHQAGDVPGALTQDFNPAPTMILLDANLPLDDLQAGLHQLKTRWPQARCLALADDEAQRQAAEAAGADLALLLGVHPARLLERIEALLVAGP